IRYKLVTGVQTCALPICRMGAAKRVADHVVHLFFAAGADAPRALNAGVQVDRHRRMRIIDLRLCASGKAWRDDIELASPVVELQIGRASCRERGWGKEGV